MSEWLKEHAWKACVRETVPRVRIPFSPKPSYCAGSAWARGCSEPVCLVCDYSPYRRVGRPKPPVDGKWMMSCPGEGLERCCPVYSKGPARYFAVILRVGGRRLPSLSASGATDGVQCRTVEQTQPCQRSGVIAATATELHLK